jgi:MFS family permease
MSWPAALRALKHRNYRLFVAGQLTSLIGTWMQSVAQGWLVYRLTGSSLLLGLIGFSQQIPVFLLSSFGGVVADRWPRRRVLICTQTVMMVLAFILAALALAGRVRIWHVFILSALLGVANAVDMPTRQAFVVEMVGKEDLVNAIALNSSMVNGARLAGPAVAGVLVAAVGEGWCFLLNGVSFLAVIGGLAAMRLSGMRSGRPVGGVVDRVVEGFGFVARTRPIRELLLLLGCVSLMGMPYTVLMPVVAREILHAGPRAYGLLMSASGVGALIGAAVLAAKRNIHGLSRWAALAAGGFGTFLILFSRSRVFWLSAALLVPVGFCMMVQMASSNTLIQSMVPDRLRGRVMAVYAMMFLGMGPFGALLAGAVARPLGVPATVASGGSACLIAAAVFSARLRGFRPLARQLIAAQQPLAVESAGTAPAGAVPARPERGANPDDDLV